MSEATITQARYLGRNMKPRLMPPDKLRRDRYGSPERPNSLREQPLDDQREAEGQQQPVEMVELVEAREHRALDDHAEDARRRSAR